MDTEKKSSTTDPLLPSGELTNPVVISTRIRRLSRQSDRTLTEVDETKSVLRKASIIIIETGVGFWKSYGGMVMALCASVFFSISIHLVKSMERYGLKAFGGALLFNTGILIPSIFGIIFNEYGPGWKRRERVFQGLWPINNTSQQWTTIFVLGLQGICQGVAVICRTCALQFLSMGDMTVIVFSSPVVTTVIAHFVLNEKCGLIFILIAIFTLIGVVLITKPPMLTGEEKFDANTLTGSGIAAGALLSLSLAFVVTRKIKEKHLLAMTFSLGLIGILMSLPLFLLFEDWDSIIPNEFNSLMLTLGFLVCFCAMSSIMLALKIENAGLVALVRSCDVIFAFLLQYIFLDVRPDLLSGIGACIVWLGVLFAGFHKYWSDKQNQMIEARKRRINDASDS